MLEGITGFITLGLSRFGLPAPTCGKPGCEKLIYHELLILARTASETKFIPSVLHQIADECLKSESPYLAGEVIGPRGPLFGQQLEALYIAPPACLPDSFQTCVDANGHAVVLVWAVPITRAEAEYVRTHGWDAFETRLEASDPDLCDFERCSVV